MEIGELLAQLLEQLLAQRFHGGGRDLMFFVDDDFQTHRILLHDE